MSMSQDRIEKVADTVASLGYDGIVEFDRAEPEWGFIESALETFDSEGHVALLSILAATEDYQLAGDAQRFWRTLEETIQERPSLDSKAAVNDVLGEFMEEPVNARLSEQKQSRLVRMEKNGFSDWFLEEYPGVDPIRVWEELADALETTQEKKTVVLAMKIYDIFNLIVNGQYLALPTDVPIPCDLQVKRVARASGIVEDESTESVMQAWADVISRVNENLDKPVSMLRLDSIVWQAGQIISQNDDRKEASRRELVEHFQEVGLDEEIATGLAHELTVNLAE